MSLLNTIWATAPSAGGGGDVDAKTNRLTVSGSDFDFDVVSLHRDNNSPILHSLKTQRINTFDRMTNKGHTQEIGSSTILSHLSLKYLGRREKGILFLTKSWKKKKKRKA
jgi:hypothetical protein